MPETDPNNHCHLFPLTIIFCASSIANVSALWHGDLPSTCLVSSGISKDEKVFVARGIKKLNTMCESINVRFMNEVDAGYCAGVLYASTRVTFHFVLRHSRHLSVIPVTSPSPPSLYFTYRSLSSFIVSPSFVFRLFLRYGSIPPLSCSEHHFSDLWLHYHTLTSSHSCGWTISLLSSWSYDLIT